MAAGNSDALRRSLLAKAGLSPPPPLDTLRPPPQAATRRTLPLDDAEARDLLASHRNAQPGSRHRERSLRNILPIKRSQQTPPTDLIFSAHEVAVVFDGLLKEQPLKPVGVAQAVCLHAAGTNLDLLWHSRHDAEHNRSGSFLHGSKQSGVTDDTEVQWLDETTRLQALDYIALLCELRPRVEVLSSAFRIAFNDCSIGAMKLLLGYGADPSYCKKDIPGQIQAGHMEFVELLLAAPRAMSEETWRDCLDRCNNLAPAVLSVCLSHRPDIANERMLVRALESQAYPTTAILLAHTNPDDLARYDHTIICSRVSAIRVHSMRYEFFALLSEAGILSDNGILRAEVTKDVKLRQMQLVRLLISAGVALDVGPKNALKHAVTKMDFEMIDVLRVGTLENVAAALDWIPGNAPEKDTLRLLKKLSALHLTGSPLHRRLITAVECHHPSEVAELIRLGASADYKEASALQTAIREADFITFDMLLKSRCSPGTLSSLIPALVRLQSKQQRVPLVQKVLDKGVPSACLGVPLEILLAEAGEKDTDCIQLLLKSGASPDVSDKVSTNSILVATRGGCLRVLKMLCEAPSIRPELLSQAVFIAFREFAFGALGQDGATEIMRLLLSTGANGIQIDQALLAAVTRGSCLGIVRLLLSHGADANHMQGDAFVIALSSKSLDVFKILCERCRPNQTSTARLIPLAVDKRYHDSSVLEIIFAHTRAKRAALDAITPKLLHDYPNMTAVLRCCLPHGLRIDSENCDFLTHAVLEGDISLLRQMLATRPSVASLSIAFKASAQVKTRRTISDGMELLLEQAAGAEIGQTDCLQHQTQLAIDGDFEGLRIVLRYGSLVDYEQGVAVQMASAAGNVKVLQLLLEYRPSIESIKNACLASVKSFTGPDIMSRDRKQAVYEALLDASAGADHGHLSSLLDTSIQCAPTDTQFPALLLERGAQIYTQTVRSALETASDDLLLLLTRKTNSRLFFQLASSSKMPAERRLWLFKDLLKRNVRSIDKSRALLYALRPDRTLDMTIVELLLQHDIDVSIQEGEAFKLAVQAQSIGTIKLLAKHITTQDAANQAFSYATNGDFANPRTRFEFYKCMLDNEFVEKRHCHAVLYACLDHHGADLDTVRLLLMKGATPNAACLVAACGLATREQFRELCKHADLDLIARVLVSSISDEADAAKWLKLALHEQPRSARITNDGLLIQCLRKYPDGYSVMRLIVQHSKSLTSTMAHSICPGWAKEECSMLIWALMVTPKISSRTILELLTIGNLDINFETSTTKLSAALACLVDSSRTPVLTALIKLRPELANDYQVDASTLARLGAYPVSPTPDDIELLGSPDLRMASFYLGNFESFQVHSNGNPVDESLLHLAAVLALPAFIEEFLRSHDPNLVLEDYKNFTPLAVAIESSSGPPWCKVATAQASFADRRKRTIELLVRRTDFTWRFRKKTYVHLAFHAGSETTAALLNALAIGNDPSKFQKLVYEDKAGRQYTPCEYVRELMGIQFPEQQALVRCLADANLLADHERIQFDPTRPSLPVNVLRRPNGNVTVA